MPSIRPAPLNFSHTRLKQRQNWPGQLDNAVVGFPTSGALTPEIQSSSSPLFESKEPTPACAIGKYIILDQIEGSSLYKAINKQTNEELACKIVNIEDHHKVLHSHFRLDSHPHINEITEVVVGEKKTYVFFPRSCGDLHAYVRNKRRLREPEAQRLFGQIASVLSYCHDNGVVLRDLKLRKFVFKDPERTQLKLETLDDAVLLENVTDDWLLDKHGCPAYVSPELLTPSGRYSGRAADCWSLGVILYTLLIGRYPFHDPDPAALFSKIRRGRFLLPDSLHPQARCLVRSLLRLDPQERLTIGDVLAHPWLTNPLRNGSSSSSSSESKGSRHENKCTDQMVPDCVVAGESSSFFT